MRLTRYDREKIIYQFKYRIMDAVLKKKHPEIYRVGISSDVVPMFEMDTRDIIVALEFTRKLCELTGHHAVISRTDNGFHIIVLAQLYNPNIPVRIWTGELGYVLRWFEYKWHDRRDMYLEEVKRLNRLIIGWANAVLRDWRLNWELLYREMLRWIKEQLHGAQYLDKLHIEMSLKRHYTTLRISGKPCKRYDIKPYLIVLPNREYYGYALKWFEIHRIVPVNTVTKGLTKWYEQVRDIFKYIRYPELQDMYVALLRRVIRRLKEMGAVI